LSSVPKFSAGRPAGGAVAEVAMTRREIHYLPDVDVGHPESRKPERPRGSGQKP